MLNLTSLVGYIKCYGYVACSRISRMYVCVCVCIDLIDKSATTREIKCHRYALFSLLCFIVTRVSDWNPLRPEWKEKGRHYLWISPLAPECLASGSTLADRIDDSHRHSRKYDSTCAMRTQGVPETKKIKSVSQIILSIIITFKKFENKLLDKMCRVLFLPSKNVIVNLIMIKIRSIFLSRLL